MNPNELTAAIVDAAYHIHREVGPGLLESVYELVLADALQGRGFEVVRQMPIPIRIGGKVFDEGFRADLVVEGSVIVEIKSVEQLARIHKKQVLTYLKLSGIHIGLLINFGGELLKGNIERLVVGDAPNLRDKEGSHGGHGVHGGENRGSAPGNITKEQADFFVGIPECRDRLEASLATKRESLAPRDE